MTLSGYLFAKLLDGKEVNYRNFFWNRAVRLLPLLAVVVVLAVLDKHLAGALDWRREIQDVAWAGCCPC
jgi:peptidoglycan/LPS O-acetylase OafA/YrhL